MSITSFFEGIDSFSKIRPGTVWLVGAGPGDPGLITLHGMNALRQADVVLTDSLVNRELLKLVPDGAKIIHIGKRGGRPSPTQQTVSDQIIDAAKANKRVVRLKGGDPFTFGRGVQEAVDLANAGIPCTVVPGISAGIGGLATAGIPITHGPVNQSVSFISGYGPDGQLPDNVDWDAAGRNNAALVLFMAMRPLARVMQKLMDHGRAPDTPVALVRNATLPDQRVLETTIARAAKDAEAAQMTSPVIICIGDTVLLRQKIVAVGSVAPGDAGDNS